MSSADRDAGEPIWLAAGLRQRLIDARLISAKRTTALEDERHLHKAASGGILRGL